MGLSSTFALFRCIYISLACICVCQREHTCRCALADTCTHGRAHATIRVLTQQLADLRWLVPCVGVRNVADAGGCWWVRAGRHCGHVCTPEEGGPHRQAVKRIGR